MTIKELRDFLAQTNLPDDAPVLVDVGKYWADPGIQPVPVEQVKDHLYDLNPCKDPNALLLYSVVKP